MKMTIANPNKPSSDRLLRAFALGTLLAALSVLVLPLAADAQTEDLYDPESDELHPAPIMVSKTEGDVTAKTSLSSQPFALKSGAKLTQGSTVVTGRNSKVNLLFANGTAIALGPNTTLIINEFLQAGGYDLASEIEESGTSSPPPGGGKFSDLEKEPSWSKTRLFFSEGSITTRTKKLDKKSEFLVGSPLGVTEVRGTTFRQSNGSNPDSLTKEIKIELQEGNLVFKPVDTPDQTNPPIEIPVGQELVLVGTFQSLADMQAASSISTVQINIVVSFNMDVSFNTAQINDPQFLAAIAQALPEGEMADFSLVGLALADSEALDTSPFFSGDQGIGNIGTFGGAGGGAGGGSGSGGGSPAASDDGAAPSPDDSTPTPPAPPPPPAS